MIIILILAIAYFFYWKGKKFQEGYAKRLQELEKEIAKKEKALIRLKNKKKTKKETEKLTQKIKAERKKLQKEKDKYKQERKKPFSNKQSYKVYINENGYEVFSNTGDLFHRWRFKHKHNRKIKPSYHIHHKDFNKRNNDIKNLEELSSSLHRQRHLDRY